jgi:hypothetical protein
LVFGVSYEWQTKGIRIAPQRKKHNFDGRTLHG